MEIPNLLVWNFCISEADLRSFFACCNPKALDIMVWAGGFRIRFRGWSGQRHPGWRKL
jgi:hypothetical protein